MTIRYVGPGGSDGASGTSWANRKLTLNGAEDTPVVAGDWVYVGPGVYRETLTCDADGVLSGANQIKYIADVTGEHTDGIGGPVRITASDDDQTATRSSCVDVNGKDYREFYGFLCDFATAFVTTTNLERLHLVEIVAGEMLASLDLGSGSPTTWQNLIKNCISMHNYSWFQSRAANTNDDLTVFDNCIFICNAWSATPGRNVEFTNMCGMSLRHCLVISGFDGIYQGNGLDGLDTVVTDSIIGGQRGVSVFDVSNDLAASYCTFVSRDEGEGGTSSETTYLTLFRAPVLFAGYRFPFRSYYPSQWSYWRAGVSSGDTVAEDIYGIDRPATASKRSRGPRQHENFFREATTVEAGLSATFPDAGRKQFVIPTRGETVTVSVKCRREANYAGTNPQMIIKQWGQSNRTTTDAGASGSWNPLSDTFTPASGINLFVVELVSDNSATSGDYAAFFDSLRVVGA